MSTPREFFTVSRVLQMTGIPLDMLDMLEHELGDHLEIRHTSGGNRLFTPKDIANLKEVKRLLDEEGKDLDEARDILFPDSGCSPSDTVPGRRSQDGETGQGSLTSVRYHVPVESGSDSDMPVEVRSRKRSFAWQDFQDNETLPRDEEALAAETGFSDPVDEAEALGNDMDQEQVRVPPLPVGPTVDLLLEATEGLVQENLKLRNAVDSLADRCLRLEEKLGGKNSRGGLFGLFRRS